MNYVLNLIKLKRHKNINSINLNQIKESSTAANNTVKLFNSSPAQNKAQLIYKLKRLKNKINSSNSTHSSLSTLAKKVLRIRTVHSEISKLKLFNNRLFKNKISKLNLFKKNNSIKDLQLKKKKIKLFRKFKISHKKRLIKLSKVSLINFYPNRLKKVCEILNKIFKKNIELKLIRLHYPYKNSNILANFLAMLINKIKFRRITRKLFKFAIIKSISKAPNNSSNAASNKIIPSFLSGLKIKIGGRLMRYKIIPRKTTQLINRGASSFGRVNYTDYARYTNKNRKGAYSITVSSGQNFFN